LAVTRANGALPGGLQAKAFAMHIE
jgi:hypothetical protein